MNFLLEQSSNSTLADWKNMLAVPTLNVTNLQNELIVPLSPSNQFFRLRH